MMFAVIRAGGKQYRVAAEDVIRIDRVTGERGQIVEFGEVLLLGGDTPQIGTPMVAGATVAGEVLQHTRGDKADRRTEPPGARRRSRARRAPRGAVPVASPRWGAPGRAPRPTRPGSPRVAAQRRRRHHGDPGSRTA